MYECKMMYVCRLVVDTMMRDKRQQFESKGYRPTVKEAERQDRCTTAGKGDPLWAQHGTSGGRKAAATTRAVEDVSSSRTRTDTGCRQASAPP